MAHYQGLLSDYQVAYEDFELAKQLKEKQHIKEKLKKELLQLKEDEKELTEKIDRLKYPGWCKIARYCLSHLGGSDVQHGNDLCLSACTCNDGTYSFKNLDPAIIVVSQQNALILNSPMGH